MIGNKEKIISIFIITWLFQFILVIIGPISYDLINMSIVFLILSFAMVFFVLGAAVRLPIIRVKYTINQIQNSKFNLLGIVILLLAFYTAKFYTGLNLFAVYDNLTSGVSNYNEYQRYFSQTELGLLSFNKIWAILSFFLVKLYFYYSIFFILISKNKNYTIGFVFGLISLFHVALARGTFFEFFEIILSISFLKIYSNIITNKSNFRLFLKLILICLLASIAHKQIVLLRYGLDGISYICNHSMCLNEDSFINTYLPSFGKLIYSLNGYFSFGYIYLAHFVDFIFINQPVLILIPSDLFTSNLDQRFLCDYNIYCDALWSPSFEGLILNLSLIGALVFMFILGVSLSILLRISNNYNSFECVILLYFIFLFFFSLPVGHLFSTSSANILVALFALIRIIYFLSKNKFSALFKRQLHKSS